MVFLFALSFVLGALGRRIAGGVLNQWFKPPGERVFGDHPARLIFGVTVAISGLFGGWPALYAAALIPAIWVGTTIGNFGGIDLGRGNGTYWGDVAALTLHGVGGIATPAILAAWVWHAPGPIFPILASGFAIGPAYTLGWALSGRIGNPHFPIGLRGGSELGEAFWGGAVAVGVFLAARIA